MVKEVPPLLRCSYSIHSYKQTHLSLHVLVHAPSPRRNGCLLVVSTSTCMLDDSVHDPRYAEAEVDRGCILDVCAAVGIQYQCTRISVRFGH